MVRRGWEGWDDPARERGEVHVFDFFESVCRGHGRLECVAGTDKIEGLHFEDETFSFPSAGRISSGCVLSKVSYLTMCVIYSDKPKCLLNQCLLNLSALKTLLDGQSCSLLYVLEVGKLAVWATLVDTGSVA